PGHHAAGHHRLQATDAPAQGGRRQAREGRDQERPVLQAPQAVGEGDGAAGDDGGPRGAAGPGRARSQLRGGHVPSREDRAPRQVPALIRGAWRLDPHRGGRAVLVDRELLAAGEALEFPPDSLQLDFPPVVDVDLALQAERVHGVERALREGHGDRGHVFAWLPDLDVHYRLLAVPPRLGGGNVEANRPDDADRQANACAPHDREYTF